jgi:UDP-N-acetylmuramate dehydrogenase
MNIRRNVPLAPLTTLGVGGEARYFAAVATTQDAVDAIRWARDRGLPLFILGAGSNLLVADHGFAGLVMRPTAHNLGHDGLGHVWAEAACPWDRVARLACANGLAGIECMSGIPGTAGAAAVQNIGAYAQQISDVLQRVEAIDMHDGSETQLDAALCGFGYRSSFFNTSAADRYLITRVHLQLRPGGIPSVRHPDFAALRASPSLRQVRAATLAVREHKGMLALPGKTRYRSAGSFFKNPVVDAALVPAGAPNWPVSDGHVKVAAGWLSSRAKDMHAGGARVSREHALCIHNRGDATAADILELSSAIRTRVQEMFGVRLEPEVRMVGFDNSL